MKKSIKLAVIAALALGATSALATNGSNLIGTGVKARAMGGASIGISHGAESGLSNAALITNIKGTEISFGGTVFMPNVKADMGAGYSNSAADLSVIPGVSIATKINDNLYVGVGMWGTAGMGVDYRDATGNTFNMNMVSNLQLMQFGVPVAYKMGNLSVGVTPILQYGSLDMNFDTNGSNPVGAGVAQDLSVGYNLGISYTTSGLTVGAVYKSEIEMEYKGQISTATQAFVDQGVFTAAMGDKLSTPAEIGIGASYTTGSHTIAADYKSVKWSDAKGYKDFQWNDQDVVAIGYAYATDGLVLRLGYNDANNPIKDAGAADFSGLPMTKYAGNAINTFNLLGFPATIKSSYTCGLSYDLSKTTSVDLAYMYAPETSTTLQTMPDSGGGNHDTTVKHSQTSLSFAVNFNY